MPEEIVDASRDVDYEAFERLVVEYWGWLRSRYSDAIDAVGAHQGLDQELKTLPTVYGPPRGRALLAVRDGQPVGCVAYRDLGAGACEMKRLFVPVRFQGQGTGRRLCEALLAVATADGYRLMRLDTGQLNTEALAMYAAMGFVRCPPYYDYPADLPVALVFMQRPLVDAGDGAGPDVRTRPRPRG